MPQVLRTLGRLSPAHQRRLDWALRGMGASLMAALQRDRSPEADQLREAEADESPEHLAGVIMERADPTSNKRFTAWLVREYAAERLLLEDLGSAHETLTLFQRYAPRLKPEARDIQRYGSLAAAWEAVRGFAEREEAHSNKAQKALDRARAYEESRILRQDPDGFTVAVPLTEFAAKWWGRGTRWCTAAEKDNAFWNYHITAPLFVVAIPERGKFQIWACEANFQFMDAADQPVAAHMSREMWPWIGTLLSATAEKNGKVLEHLPLRKRTYELCLSAVRLRGVALRWVPQEHRTYGLCLAAVQQHGGALCWTPKEHRNKETCLTAVRKDVSALQWVPEEHQSHDLWMIAVQQQENALGWIAYENHTPDLHLAAVQHFGMALDWVPEELRTAELCRVAVRQNGSALRSVPLALRSEELCRTAVTSSGWALRFVPDPFLTDDLCRLAVSQNGSTIECVPDERRSKDLCRIAVTQTGRALEHVPKRLRTKDLCLIAVKNDGLALQHVPNHLKTKEMCYAAARLDGWALNYIPLCVLNEEMCRIAVADSGIRLMCVPKPLRTEDLCRLAVAQDKGALKYVPAPLRERIATTLNNPAPFIEWDVALLDDIEAAVGGAANRRISRGAKCDRS